MIRKERSLNYILLHLQSANGMKDFEKYLITAVIGGVIAWTGQTLLTADKLPDKIKALQEEADENRESIQALIDLHMRK